MIKDNAGVMNQLMNLVPYYHRTYTNACACLQTCRRGGGRGAHATLDNNNANLMVNPQPTPTRVALFWEKSACGNVPTS